MNAIRKTIKREGNELRIVLPDDFKAEEFDVIVLPKEEPVTAKEEFNIDEYRKSIIDFYANYQADLTNFKFNRDELYDR
jgi:hypothetical protein